MSDCNDFHKAVQFYRDNFTVPGWYDPDSPGITENILNRTEQLIPYVPKNYYINPCPDGSVQWEWDDRRKNNRWAIIEVYDDYFRLSMEHDFEVEETDINKFIQLLKQKLPQYEKQP